jgi:hypothetical protein
VGSQVRNFKKKGTGRNNSEEKNNMVNANKLSKSTGNFQNFQIFLEKKTRA